MGKKIASLYAEIGADTTKLKKGLEETKTQLSKTKEGFSNFAGAMTKAFGVASGALLLVKKAMDFGKEQAMLEFTQKKFDRLSVSIGTTADALLLDLKSATGGLISDMELMASATDFMTLGLVKTHDEAVRLTSVAGQLGMNMNQLVLTLTNQTTMRFDALGVAVDGFDEKVKALKDSGMSANDAFNEAFLQQAEEQIEKVGSIADSSAASFMKMEAAVKNATDEMKRKFVPVLSDAADAITHLLTSYDKLNDVLEKHTEEVISSSKSYEEYSDEMDRVIRMLGRGAPMVRKLSEEQYELARTLQYAADSGWGMEKAALAAELAMAGMGETTEDLTTAIEASRESMDKYKALIAGDLGKELKSFEEKQKSLADESEKLNDEIGKLESKKYLTKEQKEQLEELKTKQGEIQGAIKATADEHEIATKRILLGYMEQQMGMDGLSQKEQDVLMKVAEDWGLIDEATLRAWEGMKTYTGSIDDAGSSTDELAKKLANIEKNINIDVWLKIHGLDGLEQIATMGGGGSGTGPPKRSEAGGGPNMAGENIQWGEYGRPEMFITPSSGQVVNAQQIVEAMRSSGVNMSGSGVTIDTLNVYTNSGVDAIQYSIERAKGYAI